MQEQCESSARVLHEATIHDLYLNLLKAYKGTCGRTDKDMEKMYKTDITDVMINFVVFDDDIELLSKELLSFLFLLIVKEGGYIYRHPNITCGKFIQSEYDCDIMNKFMFILLDKIKIKSNIWMMR